jgi:hypothetical protein
MTKAMNNPENTQRADAQKMLRLIAHTECLQDTQTSLAAILEPGLKNAAPAILTALGIDHELEEIEAQRLFTIEVSSNEGGCLHEGRTKPEVETILQKAGIPFAKDWDKELSERGGTLMATTTSGEIWPFTKEPATDRQPADTIADTLLTVYTKEGKGGVHQTLRCALTNYACEHLPTRQDALEANPAVLAELTEAIQTPCHLQNTP